MTSFFPAVKEDLSLLTWVHGVNNKQSLYRALQGDAMMIETDVTLGWVISSVQSRSTYHFTSQQVPIMAHPPARTSDLSLEEFLDATSNYHKPKGVKLDFKDVRVLDKAFDVITARQSKVFSFNKYNLYFVFHKSSPAQWLASLPGTKVSRVQIPKLVKLVLFFFSFLVY